MRWFWFCCFRGGGESVCAPGVVGCRMVLGVGGVAAVPTAAAVGFVDAEVDAVATAAAAAACLFVCLLVVGYLIRCLIACLILCLFVLCLFVWVLFDCSIAVAPAVDPA